MCVCSTFVTYTFWDFSKIKIVCFRAIFHWLNEITTLLRYFSNYESAQFFLNQNASSEK